MEDERFIRPDPETHGANRTGEVTGWDGAVPLYQPVLTSRRYIYCSILEVL